MPKSVSILDDPNATPTLARLFAVLIGGHAEFSRRDAKREQSPLTTRFNRLLADFSHAYRTEERADAAEAKDQSADFSGLLSAFGEAREAYRRSQENRADDFNILSVLQLTGKEVRHSMALAWLLDHDIGRAGTHAQGRLGFRLFLKEFNLPPAYADANYRVRREVVGDASIVDVEIAARGHFLIHIENKIWASEGIDQTDREWSDLQKRAHHYDLDPLAPAAPVHAFFLTPTGSKPTNANFTAISWWRIVRVLEAFALAAKPADVKLFASHYARGLKEFAVEQVILTEDNDGENLSE